MDEYLYTSIEFHDPLRIFFLGPMFDLTKEMRDEEKGGSACTGRQAGRFQSPELEPEPSSRFLG